MKDKLLILFCVCALSALLGLLVEAITALIVGSAARHLPGGSFAIGLAAGYLTYIERPFDIRVSSLLLVPLCGIAGVLGWMIAVHL